MSSPFRWDTDVCPPATDSRWRHPLCTDVYRHIRLPEILVRRKGDGYVEPPVPPPQPHKPPSDDDLADAVDRLRDWIAERSGVALSAKEEADLSRFVRAYDTDCLDVLDWLGHAETGMPWGNAPVWMRTSMPNPLPHLCKTDTVRKVRAWMPIWRERSAPARAWEDMRNGFIEGKGPSKGAWHERHNPGGIRLASSLDEHRRRWLVWSRIPGSLKNYADLPCPVNVGEAIRRKAEADLRAKWISEWMAVWPATAPGEVAA